MSRLAKGIAALVFIGAAASWGIAGLATTPSLPAHPGNHVVPLSILVDPVPDSPNATQVRRGQALVAAGDCMSCHLREHGEPLAGGLPLKTPFGTIYSPNITSDAATGIGRWSSEQFHRAMHDGIGVDGENLYPAFPYPWFRENTRADNDAILAFLKTVPPVTYTPPQNELRFPLGFRFLVKGWNLLFLKGDGHHDDPAQTAEWNRGAYLVDGLGHCSGCHTPRNVLGADKSGSRFHGGNLDNAMAPDLTSNARTGLGLWSADDIAEYLKTGRNAKAAAGSAMAEVVTYSTSLMNDADRHAIAVYMKGQASSPMTASTVPDTGAMKRGAAIYGDVCTACHLENGVGQPRYFPPLGNNAMVQQIDPVGVEHVILAGSRTGPSPSRPSPLTMPSFSWKLSNAEIADVSTYVRNSWGNQAPPVSADQVSELRMKLNLETDHLTVNSGDR